jgi:hypothetical protein
LYPAISHYAKPEVLTTPLLGERLEAINPLLMLFLLQSRGAPGFAETDLDLCVGPGWNLEFFCISHTINDLN